MIRLDKQEHQEGDISKQEEEYLRQLRNAGAPTVAPEWLVGRESVLCTGRRLGMLPSREGEGDA